MRERVGESRQPSVDNKNRGENDVTFADLLTARPPHQNEDERPAITQVNIKTNTRRPPLKTALGKVGKFDHVQPAAPVASDSAQRTFWNGVEKILFFFARRDVQGPRTGTESTPTDGIVCGRPPITEWLFEWFRVEGRFRHCQRVGRRVRDAVGFFCFQPTFCCSIQPADPWVIIFCNNCQKWRDTVQPFHANKFLS